jgi:protocatechuate 3,4-dioxygenase beta subunit
MDGDDLPIGRVLDRREALRLLALGGAALLAGCERDTRTTDAAGGEVAAGDAARAPGCLVRPELTEGPYFVDTQLERSDVRAEPSTGALTAGIPLALAFSVSEVTNGRCAPLAGALVDVWQCDAAGAYSGVRDMGFDTAGLKFLRGYQVTGKDGVARFTTIYPGWYRGRAVHVHFKIRVPAAVAGAAAAAGERAWEFTSQLFFDEALTDRVHARAPYAAKGRRDTPNARDGIYREAGDQLLLRVADSAEGYAGTFDVGLDLSDARAGRPDGMRGPGGRRGPGGPPPRRSG